MALAGMTSSSRFHLAPLAPRLVNKPISFPLETSRLLGLHSSRLGSNYLFHASCPPTPRYFTIAARYGGSGSQNDLDDEDEKALDISSIRSNSVRLIDEKQDMVGVVPKSDAIRMAEDSNLDLVILSPDADPPVVRIMDYNKFKYEQQKRRKVQQKKSASTRMELKELKMGYNIDQHDYSVRLKAAKKFIKDGDKVKVIVSLKGRENDFRSIAIELLRRFQNDVGELATEESKKFSDRNMFIVLVPNKAILQKAQEVGKKNENSIPNQVSASV